MNQSMRIKKDIQSPNFNPVSIPVEFLVLHYTAGNLERALKILTDPERGVSSHFVIARDGEIFELVKCRQGTAFRAHHAGVSRWSDGTTEWDSFNDFSVGIELVNPNGNVLPYTNEQYSALQNLVEHLKEDFPALKDPNRVLGHEHIAAWRGKVDPGALFDWDRFFNSCYSEYDSPHRPALCPEDLKTALAKFLKCVPDSESEQEDFWHAVNYITEVGVGLALKSGSENA